MFENIGTETIQNSQSFILNREKHIPHQNRIDNRGLFCSSRSVMGTRNSLLQSHKCITYQLKLIIYFSNGRKHFFNGVKHVEVKGTMDVQ